MRQIVEIDKLRIAGQSTVIAERILIAFVGSLEAVREWRKVIATKHPEDPLRYLDLAQTTGPLPVSRRIQRVRGAVHPGMALVSCDQRMNRLVHARVGNRKIYNGAGTG